MSFIESVQGLVAKNGRTALAATAVIATSMLVYKYFAPSSSGMAPAIEEAEARKIMNAILEKLKVLGPQLEKAARNIKAQIQDQGQEVDEMTIRKQFLLPHFESNLKEIQTAVLEEFDADEDDLEEAVSTYIAAGDEELSSIAKSIRVFYKDFGGDVEVEDPDKVSEAVEKMGINDVVALMKELGNQMMQHTDDFCGNFIDEHGLPSTAQLAEEFQMGLMAASQR
jgi:hypothetical protein